jgi:hypothetical protein
VAVGAKGHIIRQVGPIMRAISLGLVSPSVVGWRLIGIGTGVTIHPLGRVPAIYPPITLMSAGKRDRRSTFAPYGIIVLLCLVGIMAPFTGINLDYGVAEAPLTL